MKKQMRRGQKRKQQQKEGTSMLAPKMELLQRRQRVDALREELRLEEQRLSQAESDCWEEQKEQLERQLQGKEQIIDYLVNTFSEIHKDIATLNKKASSAAQVLTQKLATTTTSLSSMALVPPPAQNVVKQEDEDLHCARTIYLVNLLQNRCLGGLAQGLEEALTPHIAKVRVCLINNIGDGEPSAPDAASGDAPLVIAFALFCSRKDVESKHTARLLSGLCALRQRFSHVAFCALRTTDNALSASSLPCGELKGTTSVAGRPLSISLRYNKYQRCRSSANATAIESIVGALRSIHGRRPVAVATA